MWVHCNISIYCEVTLIWDIWIIAKVCLAQRRQVAKWFNNRIFATWRETIFKMSRIINYSLTFHRRFHLHLIWETRIALNQEFAITSMWYIIMRGRLFLRGNRFILNTVWGGFVRLSSYSALSPQQRVSPPSPWRLVEWMANFCHKSAVFSHLFLNYLLMNRIFCQYNQPTE